MKLPSLFIASLIFFPGVSNADTSHGSNGDFVKSETEASFPMGSLLLDRVVDSVDVDTANRILLQRAELEKSRNEVIRLRESESVASPKLQRAIQELRERRSEAAITLREAINANPEARENARRAQRQYMQKSMQSAKRPKSELRDQHALIKQRVIQRRELLRERLRAIINDRQSRDALDIEMPG